MLPYQPEWADHIIALNMSANSVCRIVGKEAQHGACVGLLRQREMNQRLLFLFFFGGGGGVLLMFKIISWPYIFLDKLFGINLKQILNLLFIIWLLAQRERVETTLTYWISSWHLMVKRVLSLHKALIYMLIFGGMYVGCVVKSVCIEEYCSPPSAWCIFIAQHLIPSILYSEYVLHFRSYSFYIEVSMDDKDYDRIIDHTSYLCRSWQKLHFPARVVRWEWEDLQHHNSYVYFSI